MCDSPLPLYGKGEGGVLRIVELSRNTNIPTPKPTDTMQYTCFPSCRLRCTRPSNQLKVSLSNLPPPLSTNVVLPHDAHRSCLYHLRGSSLTIMGRLPSLSTSANCRDCPLPPLPSTTNNTTLPVYRALARFRSGSEDQLSTVSWSLVPVSG